MSRETIDFEWGLAKFINVGLPATKALSCLEAKAANPADVYLFWHAVMHATKDVVSNKKAQFPLRVQHEIIGILNARYRQIFVDGNLANTVYLAAVYLNPGKFTPFCSASY
jgi:hypothetical protein